jgi:hypothetical protein
MSDILTAVDGIDICGLCCDEAINRLPDADPEGFDETLAEVIAALPGDTYMDLESAINSLRVLMFERGFRAGWQMRSRA